jgi:membrane protease YdiL (CAAX protease family)
MDIQLKPLSLPKAALLFAVPSAIITWALFVGIRLLTEAGWAPFSIVLAVLVAPLAAMFVAALVAYRWEGNPWTWERFRTRMRLQALRGSSAWLWTLALTVLFIPIGTKIIYPVALALAALAVLKEGTRGKRALTMIVVMGGFVTLAAYAPRLLSPLSSIVFYTMPAEVMDFMGQIQPTSFFGIELSGNWWLPIFYLFVVMFLNIFGEELWWRGFILPRQELAHGRWTWIIHGLLWTGFHIFWTPDLASLLSRAPTYLALAFVCQRLANTWPGIIAHFVGNSPILLVIIGGVLK